MAFSGALTLTDLNDYITPSQACIKPVEQKNNPANELPQPGAAATEIRIDLNGAYYEVSVPKSNVETASISGSGSGKKLETAEISLNDCLACSGCITSAESVLITLQSHTEVLNFLSSNAPPSSASHKIPVISISPQSIASLAASVSASQSTEVSLDEVLTRIQHFCTTSLGFAHVFDTTFARHLSLMEHVYEFRERKQASRTGGTSVSGQLPMLASACPGWVCYAEKTHAEMLPFISRTKSPQQIMGTIVKEWLGPRWGTKPDQIYHVTVMPCYDKKLEASRQDFYNEIYQTRDVDCVLTTGELQLLMQEKGFDLSLPVPSSSASSSEQILPRLLQHPGSSSGSYLYTILLDIASSYSPSSPSSSQLPLSSPTSSPSLPSCVPSSSPLPLHLEAKTIRTSDYEEYTLTDTQTSEIVFKGARCYGFRNLQNVVRKVAKSAGIQSGKGAAGRLGARKGGAAGAGVRTRVKKRATAGAGGGEEETLVDVVPAERGYDYVEVMACPGGCVNGGGQLRPSEVFLASSSSNQPLVTGLTSGQAPKDEEGFVRNWNESGVVDGSTGGVGVASAKWGDKKWVKVVERTYWGGEAPQVMIGAGDLPTPPESPKFKPQDVALLVNTERAKVREADELAVRILKDLCQPIGVGVDRGKGEESMGRWSEKMADEAEARRRKLFRTEYRAVESEVVGLAVKW